MFATLVMSLALGASAPAPSIVGASLDDAQASPFFTGFHFVETARSADSAGQWIQFRPTGDYQGQVRLWLHITPAGTINQATLDLARSLIEPRPSQTYARDAASSFLQASVPDQDGAAVEALANTIWQDRDPGRFDPAVAGVDRDARVVAGYRAFLGYSKRYHDILTRTWLTFENLPVDGDPVLRLSIGLE